MKLYKEDSFEKMSERAASIIAAQLILKPDSVLGLATGSSVLGIYRELVRRHRESGLDFSCARTVNLDEYVGLEEKDSQSYRHFMNENLFCSVNIDIRNTFVPDGCATDFEAHCLEYDKKIKELGGLDLQLLGIGNNGHIGFNEPGDCFAVGTHTVELSRSTLNANSRFFTGEKAVPRRAVSMGIDSIFAARKILLVAGGEKREILSRALYGPITPELPASILQLHPDLTVIYVSDGSGAELCEA